MTDQNNIMIYQSKEGAIELSVSLESETVWLSQKQMAQLFGKDIKTINQHIRHIYEEGELKRVSTLSKSKIVQKEGGRIIKRELKVYSLDVIISVGYRVKSHEGVQFRIWATKVLREHILNGYTFNQKRLAEKGVKDLEDSFMLIQQTLLNQDLVNDIGRGALKIVSDYAKSWRVLLAYDEDQLALAHSGYQLHKELSHQETISAVAVFKEKLMEKGEASQLFGNEREHGLAGILGNIEQTFAGKSLYKSVEEKAANLLYFVIKDHPFTDGNKRIGCLLFLLYLVLQGIPFGLNDNGMIALALLTAESQPSQKDLMVKLITNLIYQNK